MINPDILEYSDIMVCDEEWCLSVPWKKWQVERSASIKLAYQDKKWIVRTLALEGLRARIVQHEIDHLNWILFVDKLKTLL
jgi:peptide deformylase